MTEVRGERAGDPAAIRAVLAVSFPTEAEARLVDLLRDAGRLTVSLVAEDAGEVVGHVAFSPVSVARAGGARSSAAAVAEWTAGAGLAPLAVAESHRRRGVGAALVRAGLEACLAAGVGWVVVLGDPAYYGRFGFLPAADAGLHDEYGGGPAFQALELRSGALPAGAGLVRYSREFAIVG